MQLWRLHIRPGGAPASLERRSTEFCLQCNIVGMGWAVESAVTDWPSYEAAVRAEYDDHAARVVGRFAQEAQIGDLAWFRTVAGIYYLAEFVGPWRYENTPEHLRADIVNLRSARIVEVGLADRVPGRVITAFIPSSTFQRIGAVGMLEYAISIAHPDRRQTLKGDLFDFLSPTDIEDVIAVYLQFQGWLIIPGTRRADTAHYEFVLAHRDSGERAVVQIKSGDTRLDAAGYADQTTTFLFAASGNYGTARPPNVQIIERKALNGFMAEHPRLLPAAVIQWISLLAANPAPGTDTDP